jgi:hypothetical protein
LALTNRNPFTGGLGPCFKFKLKPDGGKPDIGGKGGRHPATGSKLPGDPDFPSPKKAGTPDVSSNAPVGNPSDDFTGAEIHGDIFPTPKKAGTPDISTTP